MSGRDARERIALFPSELGWMAVHGRGNLVLQLAFGAASPDLALAQLDGVRIGPSTIGSWNRALVMRLQAFAKGARDEFLDIELDLGSKTGFQERVIDRCRRIGFGETMTYGELAAAAGFPHAARAVGNVMRANRIGLIVPCHRVVGAGGGVRGNSTGEDVRLKLRLLEKQADGTRKSG